MELPLNIPDEKTDRRGHFTTTDETPDGLLTQELQKRSQWCPHVLMDGTRGNHQYISFLFWKTTSWPSTARVSRTRASERRRPQARLALLPCTGGLGTESAS